MHTIAKLVAALGGVVLAGAGAVMGSLNAGWIALPGGANSLFPAMGIGVLLLGAGWIGCGWGRRLWDSRLLGRAAALLVVVGAAFFLLNPLLEFAILGTLAFGLGLVLLAVELWRTRRLRAPDRVLVTLAAVASLTWNTETPSAFLLVAVGLFLAIVSLRLGEPTA